MRADVARPGCPPSPRFVFVNIGFTFIIIICLLAMTPRADMQSAKYVFTKVDNRPSPPFTSSAHVRPADPYLFRSADPSRFGPFRVWLPE